MTTATRLAADTTTASKTLYMVRAGIDGREFRRWMGSRQLEDADHAMHCLLTECFGDLAPKPFRLMMPRDGRGGTLYGYASAQADALRDMASMCACPLQERVLPLAGIDSKPMPSAWQQGRRLGFEVRVRPIVRLQRDLDRVPEHKLRLFRHDRRNVQSEFRPRPGAECDAFQYEAIKYPKGEMRRSREEVYRDWLQRRLENQGGAVLDSEEVKMVSFRRTRAIRKLRSRYSEGPDAIMRGELEITDGAKFAQLLADGIGRHKAYGYGMLLLRPVISSRA